MIEQSQTLRNLNASNTLAAIDAGTGPGRIILRAGSTVIATLVFSKPAGTLNQNVLTFDVDPLPQDSSADTSGVVDNFHLTDSAGTVALTGTVTATGSSGDATMPNPSVAAGEPVQLDSMVLTF